MDATAVIAVSGAIVMLLQVLKSAGLTGRWALVSAAVMSMVGVGVWAYSQGNYGRPETWGYFAGWIAVFTSAAGVFGIVNGGAEAVTAMKGAPSAIIKSLTSTGDGRNPATLLLPLLIVSALAAGVSSCATVQPNPPVDTIQKARNEAAVLAKSTKEAASLAVQARRVAQTAYDSKAISAAVMQKINNAALEVERKGLAFIAFAETVTTEPSLKVTATELYKVFQSYIDALGESGQTGAAIKTALQAFIVYLGVQ